MAEQIPNLFKNHAVRQITLEELKGLSENLGISATEQELQSYYEIIGGFTQHYDRVAELSETVGDLPPVKYPRTPGRKPRPEENPLKAWTYKTEIVGAPNGKLKGKTVAVKDNVAVAGVPMMNGSHLLDTHIPKYDATAVTRLLDAGVTILGKAACEDFCYSGGSFSCVTGPVLNPVDTTRNAGGSSAGSGALVAAGEVDLAIGCDQGGSVRIPASWCGVVGLKPTFSLVPYTGAITLEPSIDHMGPLARTVKECAQMLEIMAGYDPMDPRQSANMNCFTNFPSLLTGDIKGKKIGLLKEAFTVCKDDVQSVVREAVKRLEAAEAIVEEVSVPSHKDAFTIWFAVAYDGSYNAMIDSSFLSPGSSGFHDVDLHCNVHQAQKSRRSEMSPILKLLSLFGEYNKCNYGHKFYGKAQNLVPWVTAEYDRLLTTFDALLMPTLPHVAPKIPSNDVNLPEYFKVALDMTPNTAPFNITGHPALTINAGYSRGLPVGMQFVGKKFDDGNILNIAYAFEKTASVADN